MSTKPTAAPPSEDEVSRAKETFLINNSLAAKKGVSRAQALQGAFDDVRLSTFRHNPTWREYPVVDGPTRSRVHARHESLLRAIYDRYEEGSSLSEEDVIGDLENLVLTMNEEFANLFR